MVKALGLSAIGILAVVGLVILARPGDSDTPTPGIGDQPSGRTDPPAEASEDQATSTLPPEQAGSPPEIASDSSPPSPTTGAQVAPPPPTEEAKIDEPVSGDQFFFWLWAEPGEIRLIWRDGSQRPYHQLEAGRRALETAGETVLAIGNGGIYEPGLIPAGLHVEQGRQLVPLNERSGNGNFYLQPNGVFWIGDGEATVDDTATFAQKYSPTPTSSGGAQTVDGRPIDLALQSGPMLVVDGQANPRFGPDAPSKHIRNAVAVDAQGRVLLIISRQPINLRRMADKCLELGAVDALYLDGSISRLEQPAEGRPIFPNIPVAAMLAVVEPS